MRTKKTKTRLQKSDWLSLALEVLSKEGDALLRITPLCAKLGVTKGSFYAHFQNRADFVSQCVDYWAEELTQRVIATLDQFKDKPGRVRLLALMRMLRQERYARFDVPIRAWATHDKSVTKGIKRADKLRYDFVRQIFHDIGFRGADLDTRTRIFVTYHSLAAGMRLPASKLDADKEINQVYQFFIRK